MSMLVGVVAVFTLPKFPDAAKWLKHDQRVYLYNKLEKDRGEVTVEKMTMSELASTAKDPLLWLQGSVYAFAVGTANATAFFAPSIIRGLGYSGLDASLRSAWPFFGALGFLMITATISDKFQKRATVCLAALILMITGFSIMRVGFSPEVRYLGIFFATMGVHSTIPAVLALNQTNILGSSARSVSSGILIACGAIGSIIGSLIFREQDAPSYGPGIYTTIGLTTWNVFAIIALVIIYRRRNKAADRDGTVIQGVPGFRYSL